MIDKHKNARVCFTGALLLALSATLPARADYQSTVLSQNPSGYWRLNETVQPQNVAGAVNSGTLGASVLGTYVNFPERQLPGPFTGSSAVGFDGGSQSVSTPWQAAINPNTFSVEMWVKPSVIPIFRYVASSIVMASPRSGWYLAQDDGSTFGAGSAFVVRMFNQNAATYTIQLSVPITLPADSWYHLVLTYDGTTAALYSNGTLAGSGPAAYVANVSAPFTVGMRSDTGFPWPGQVAEVAMYGSALSATRVTAHYTAATTAPATYASSVNTDAPLLYYRFQEAIDPPAANLGSLGTAAKGLYIYPAQAGAAGPVSPAFAGFEAANKAAAFTGAGGAVQIPALKLNTNTVTYTAWVKAAGAQPIGAGIVVSGSAASACGLTMDQVFGGLGIGYIWNGNNYGISPTSDLSLPPLPDNQWAFAAVVIEPTKATLYTCDGVNYANFSSVVNTLNVNHQIQPFDSPTLVGSAAGATPVHFNGAIDEVTIFNRALSPGELYSQYATGAGGVPPRIFTDLQGPTEAVAAGDPLVLTIDAGGTADLTYTWRKNGSTVGTTTNGVFTIASTVLGDAGTYDVTISNGSGSAASQQVIVTTVTPTTPAIVELSGYLSRTLYPTGTLAMAVVATGGGLKYQWYKDSSPIAGGTSSSYRVNRIADSSVAGSYSVFVTNSVGTVTSGPPAVITIPTVPTGSYEDVIVKAGPQAWWRLDETAGTNMFDAMGRFDGTYTNATGAGALPTLGAAGALLTNANKAATFSSSGKGIGIVPFSPALNPQKFTIEAWVKTTVIDGQVPVSSFYDVNGCWMQSVGGWWYGFNGGGQYGNNNLENTNAAIVSGYWSHVVLRYDATQQSGGTFYPWTLYVNGETDGYIWGGSGPNIAGPFIIGARGVNATTLADRFFDGTVDEVAVYDRILSQTELRAHYTARGTEVIPPSFTTPFLSQTVAAGKTVNFTTSLLGTTPISLQWYKGAAPLGGQTTPTLTLANVTTTDAGTYTLWATNSAGTASQSATLNVITPTGYANVTNDLVLHLRFDGDANDSSGRSNNGTPSTPTAPAYVPGIVGSQALEYTTAVSGTTVTSASYVRLGAPADLLFGSATSFTIGTWVKLAPGSTIGDLPFIGTSTNSMNNPGWALGPTYQTGGWQWCLNDGTVNLDVNGPDNSINDGNWHNFVLVVDRTAKLAQSYLDGVLVASRDITALGNINNNNSPIVIGQDPTGLYPEPGTSILDDLGVWRRALTATDVANIAAAGSAGRSFDTVAPASVTITVSKSGSSVTFSWSQGTLLQADTPNAVPANWTPVPGASAPSYTFTPPTTGSKYYRVQLP